MNNQRTTDHGPRTTDVLALELFCGIGGFAAAVEDLPVTVVGALDQSLAALAVYRLNFPGHPARAANLEHAAAGDLAAFGADLWWLSPPCQPYCVRGARRDLDDPRARSLLRLLAVLAELPDGRLPAHLALENVEGFAGSAARERLLAVLAARGYGIRELHLCPTALGVPSRRPRYYLAASRAPLRPVVSAPRPPRPLHDYLDPPGSAAPELFLPAAAVERFGDGLRLLDPDDPAAYTTCFTAGYGRALMRSGAFLRDGGRVRRFSPAELARLLHFPARFRFPAEMPLAKQWHLLGNSLSVISVRELLKAFDLR